MKKIIVFAIICICCLGCASLPQVRPAVNFMTIREIKQEHIDANPRLSQREKEYILTCTGREFQLYLEDKLDKLAGLVK